MPQEERLLHTQPHPTEDQKSPPETRKSPAGSRTFHANSHFTASCPAPPHPLNTLNVPTSAPLSISSTTQPAPACPAKVTLFSVPRLQSPALPGIAQGHPLPRFHPSKALASFPRGRIGTQGQEIMACVLGSAAGTERGVLGPAGTHSSHVY